MRQWEALRSPWLSTGLMGAPLTGARAGRHPRREARDPATSVPGAREKRRVAPWGAAPRSESRSTQANEWRADPEPAIP
jgi:hypothetical protein